MEQTRHQTTIPQPEPSPEHHPPLLQVQHRRQLLAEAFGVSQATISKTIHRIENALLKLEELKIPTLESLKNIPGSLMVDGTLIPVKELGFTRANTVFR